MAANRLQDQLAIALNVLGRLRPLAIVLVGAALVGTIFAGNQLRLAVSAYQQAQDVSGDKGSKVKLARQPLTAEDYTRYGGIIAGLVPGVRVSIPADGKSMRVAINDAGAYELWVYALNNLQSYSKNVVWEADTLCLQDCGGETVASAQITGYIQTAEFEQ
jgi:hypothetical protein